MKFLLTTLFLYLLFQTGYSQEINGYFINIEGDTIPACIKVPKGLFGNIHEEHLFTKVKITDSSGETQFKPGEIKSFSFTYKNKQYAFYSKPVRKYNFSWKATKDTLFRFMTIFSKGEHATGYSCYSVVPGDKTSSVHILYTLERRIDNAHLYLHNYGKLEEMRTALTDFYSHVPSVASALSNKFIARRKVHTDIPAAIEALNR